MTLSHDDVQGWLDRYVEAWQSYDPGAIGDLFSADADYRYHPNDEPVRGRDAIVADYAGLLAANPRYAGALNTGADVHAFATALQRGGYATDPEYAHKLVATAAAVRELRAQAALKSASGLPTTSGQGTA